MLNAAHDGSDNLQGTMINISRNRQTVMHVVVCLLFIFMYGCNGSAGVKHFTRPNVDIKHIKKIAVLPFDNFTNNAFAHEKMRSLVNMDLLSRGIEVAEPGEVIKVLQELKIASVKSVSPSDVQSIGEALKVNAVLAGSVSAFETVRGMSVSYPEVSVNLILYEATSGNIAWSVWHTAGGASFWTRHFGSEGATIEETSERVIEEALDTLF